MQNQNNVAFNKVSEAHKNWNYSQSGLTPAGAAIIAIAVTVATMGAGAAVGGTAASSAGVGAGVTATTATGSVVLTGASGVMANAALSTLAAQASVSLINNKGDIGKVLQDMGSDETLKSLAFAVATAGVTAGIGNGVANSLFSTAPITPQQFAMLSTGTKVVTTATVGATAHSTIYGSNIGDGVVDRIKNGAIYAVVDVGAGNIGEAYHLGAINEPVHLALHGALGCAAGAAISGNCGTGAAGQVAGELAGELYKNSGGTDLQTGLGIAQISGGVAAVLAGGDEKDVYAGANIGQAAAENNSFAVAGPATPELIAACVAMPVACATLGAAAVLAIYVAQKRTNAEGFDIAGAVEQLPGYEASSDEGFVDQGVDVATNTPATEGFDAYEPSVGNNDEGFSILPDWLTNGWNVLFSENAKFSDQGKLDDHFDRHGQDFNASTATEYEKQASDFLTSQSSSDILEKIRSNGDLIRFNPKTDEFGVISSNGTIRTYFSMLSV